MEYKVIPFIASIQQNKDTTLQVAEQLEKVISSYTSKGWTFVRVENVSTHVKNRQGCFNLENKDYITTHQVIVFSK